MFENQKRKREYKKRKKAYKDGITLEELAKTLKTTEKIINILFKKSINDFFLFYKEKFKEEPQILKYKGRYIWNDKKMISPTIYCTDSNTPYTLNGSYESDHLCHVITCFLGLFINKDRYYYWATRGLETDNFDSFLRLFNRISKINAIVYKDEKSKFITGSGSYKDDEIFSNDIEFEYIEEKGYILKRGIKIKDEYNLLELEGINKEKVQLNIQDDYLIIKNTFYIDLLEEINGLSYLLNKEDLSFYTENKNNKIILKTKDLFDKSGKIKEFFLQDDLLKNYDLSNINFDSKNISDLDISHNPEVNINFDRIIKDLTNSNISGYNLNKYTFRNFNLTNTDLRNTGATIDIGTCMISYEGKMNPGTLFDEDNKFILGNKTFSCEEMKNMGIKIYKKEKNNEKREIYRNK